MFAAVSDPESPVFLSPTRSSRSRQLPNCLHHPMPFLKSIPGPPSLQPATRLRVAWRLRSTPLAISLILVALIACCPSAASQEPTAARWDQLEVGLGGVSRVGRWTPVSAQLSLLPAGVTISFDVTASDTRGDRCTSTIATTTADATGNATLRGVFMPGRLEDRIEFSVRDDSGRRLASHELNAAPETDGPASPATEDSASVAVRQQLLLHTQAPVSLLTAGRPAGLAELQALLAGNDQTRDALRMMFVAGLDALPDSLRGWDAVDIALLVDQFELSATQTRALQDWVLSGGHLIVSSGQSHAALLQSEPGHWIQSLFGLLDGDAGQQRVLDLSPLQAWVPGATSLQTNRQTVTLTRIPSDQARVVVGSLSGPLIARRSAGAGIVTFIGVDLNTRPVDRWLSLPQFYEQLLFDRQLDRTDIATSRRGRISSSGMTDLSTQLTASIDAIPSRERWSSWQALLLMLAWLVVVGPLDYWLVSHLFGRPVLTWVTFPVLVLGAITLTWRSSPAASGDAVVRQLHLLDVAGDATQPEHLIRRRTWSSLSTADSRRSTIESRDTSGLPTGPAGSEPDTLVWYGRAENVFGGLYRPGGSGLGRRSSRRTDTAVPQFSETPLLANGSQEFLAEQIRHVAAGTVVVSELTHPTGSLLEGSFRHQLPYAINNWMMVYLDRVYVPGHAASDEHRRLDPGELWSRETTPMRVADLKDYLRAVRSVQFDSNTTRGSSRQSSLVQSEWNPANRNPLEILTMISLYERVGGQQYLKLNNHGFRRDELARSLQLNTAVLIGTLAEPLGELMLDGQPVRTADSQTIVRLLLPVRRIQRALPDSNDD
jgi:hypothetical protein